MRGPAKIVTVGVAAVYGLVGGSEYTGPVITDAISRAYTVVAIPVPNDAISRPFTIANPFVLTDVVSRALTVARPSEAIDAVSRPITVVYCPWDYNRNGTVDVTDLLALLAVWGPTTGHPMDFDEDGLVGVTDLLAMLAHWGACP